MKQMSQLLNKISVKYREFIQPKLILIAPYFIILSYVFLLLESYIYPGFLTKVILINSISFSLFTLCFVFFINTFLSDEQFENNNKSDYLLNLVIDLNQLFSPALLFIYYLLTKIEEQNYPNYVFSTFHFHPYHFRYFVLFNLGLVSSKLFKNYREDILKIVGKLLGIDLYLFLFIVFCLGYFSLKGFIAAGQSFVTHMSYVISNPFLSYEQKRENISSDYRFFRFINDHTPSNALIAVPPQEGPWLTCGNIGYIRYFLYPRKITQAVNRDLLPPDVDYMLIAQGEWASPDGVYGWPQATVSAQKIWYFDRTTYEVSEPEETTFDLHKHPELYKKWGIMKIKGN